MLRWTAEFGRCGSLRNGCDVTDRFLTYIFFIGILSFGNFRLSLIHSKAYNNCLYYLINWLNFALQGEFCRCGPRIPCHIRMFNCAMCISPIYTRFEPSNIVISLLILCRGICEKCLGQKSLIMHVPKFWKCWGTDVHRWQRQLIETL